jgi:Asp-tRNA(Asn)/Glu-tRNA(Gln) amidotransferase A subunit family amidase
LPVQLAGRPFEDRIVLAAASRIEAALGERSRRPLELSRPAA